MTGALVKITGQTGALLAIVIIVTALHVWIGGVS